MFNKRKSLLLGILAAATATGLALGVNGVVDAYVGEPVEVSAASQSFTRTMTYFTATSGNLDGDSNLYYSCAKNNGTSDPATKDGEIRLYQNKKGDDGGSITVKVTGDYKITSATIGSSMSTTIRVYDDTDDNSTNDKTGISLAANATYEASELEASSFTFVCKGTSSNARLYVNYLSVTYEYLTEPTPVTSIEVNSDSDSVYEDGSLQMTATVNEDATNKYVDWSVEPADYASIDEDGILTGHKAGEVTVTATAADGSGVTGSKTITILEDPIEDFKLVTGSPAVQYAGQPFDSTGLVFEATYLGKGTLTVDHSSIVFAPETIQKDTTEVTATFDGETIVIPVQISKSEKYYFGDHKDFVNFPTSYAGSKADLGYDTFNVHFEGAIITTTTITDKPVSKKGTVTVTAGEGYVIKKIELGFEQWTTKEQTINLSISFDGTSYGNVIDSLNIPSDPMTLGFADESGFKAAKFVSVDTDNQVAWDYIDIEIEEQPSQANDFAETFLSESLCNDGVTAPDTGIWETLDSLYVELSASDKEIFKTAVADVSGTEVEQCVARYDYIVGKYGAETYNDFMGRNPARIASALSIHNSDDVMDIAVISALAIAGIAAAGAFVFLRRKKEA